MRLLLLGLLLGIGWGVPVSAEEYSFESSPAVATYKVATNSFVAKVRHPFQVVRISGRNLKGTLLLTPKTIQKGIFYSIELDLEDLDEPEGALGSAVVSMLKTKKIKISGTSMTILKLGKTPSDLSYSVLHPRIDIGGRVSFPEVKIQSSLDGNIIRWNFQSQFTLSDFSIPVPKKWGIPAEDKVVVEGEVNFAPKE
jgi:hypothetical protein